MGNGQSEDGVKRNNSKNLRVVLLMVAMLSAPCLAEESVYETREMPNGRRWKDMDEQARTWFVYGFSEGLVIALAVCATDNCTKILRQYRCDCTFGELSRGITEFYLDESRAALPVVVAHRVFVMKTKGALQEEIDAEISRALKLLAARPG